MTDSKIKACVFDAYGTLFDVHSAVGRYRETLAEKADAVSGLWRVKQLEYTWLRSLMGKYIEFYALTGDALDYALETHGIDDPGLRRNLLKAYLSLSCYTEVPETLARLKASGISLAILSNGSPAMLEAAVTSSGLDSLFDALLSVDSLGIYKPDPSVYRLATESLGVQADQVMFQSSNAWDAVGAKAFGFNVCWVNRFGQAREKLGFDPDFEVDDLSKLPELVAAFG